MKQISNKEYEKYQQYLTEQLHGRTLTPCFCFLVTKCCLRMEKIGLHKSTTRCILQY